MAPANRFPAYFGLPSPEWDPWSGSELIVDAVAALLEESGDRTSTAALDPVPIPGSAPFLAPADFGAGVHEVRRDGRRDVDHPLPPPPKLPIPHHAIAFYRPWHFVGEAWGIYIVGPELERYASQLAQLAGLSAGAARRAALSVILAHEYTHFAVEVTARQVEFHFHWNIYRPYALHRYVRQQTWSQWPGPVAFAMEELFATWAEVAYAQNNHRIRGLATAVKKLADLSPPGYRYWARAETDYSSVVGALIADLCDMESAGDRWRWLDTLAAENRQVPIYWVGVEEVAASYGLQKTGFNGPEIRLVERWLLSQGAEISPGKGSHRHYHRDGRTGTYSTSAGFLLGPEAGNMARFFNFENKRALAKAIVSS